MLLPSFVSVLIELSLKLPSPNLIEFPSEAVIFISPTLYPEGLLDRNTILPSIEPSVDPRIISDTLLLFAELYSCIPLVPFSLAISVVREF